MRDCANCFHRKPVLKEDGTWTAECEKWDCEFQSRENMIEKSEDLISRNEAEKLGATCLAKRNENGQLEAIISLDNAPTVELNEMTQDLIDKVNVNVGLAQLIKNERPQGDLISREALKKAICIDEPISIDETWEQLYDAVVKAIDNAPTVELFKPMCKAKDEAICEEMTTDGHCNCLKPCPNKEEKPQGEWIENKVIIETLREMLSNLCMGCGGCNDKCLDYRVLEYLLKEKGGVV